MTVIEFGAHTRMTPEQALALASREEWEHVIILGYHKEFPNEIVSRSSSMNRETALWLLESAKLHALGSL